ncbi:MAG: hypothetical protein IPM04_16010 [Saprospiraceae bacterium]|jgi:hypothetical protein|nr:hypothetical protein [Candidatus Brachybacter algidus]MBK8749260.1 hypothetical protein [Candidatus Brachybacter algidus]
MDTLVGTKESGDKPAESISYLGHDLKAYHFNLSIISAINPVHPVWCAAPLQLPA